MGTINDVRLNYNFGDLLIMGPTNDVYLNYITGDLLIIGPTNDVYLVGWPCATYTLLFVSVCCVCMCITTVSACIRSMYV
jgi:hypothetical protein